MGWLIIPVFIFLIFALGGWRRGFPLALVFSGASLFSHDMLFSIPIVSGFVFALTGMCYQPTKETTKVPLNYTDIWHSRVIALSATLIIATFSIGTITTILNQKQLPSTLPVTISEYLNKNVAYVPIPPLYPTGMFRRDNSTSIMSKKYSNDSYECSWTIEEVLQGKKSCAFIDQHAILFKAKNGLYPLELSTELSVHPLFIFVLIILMLWVISWWFLAFRSKDNLRSI